MRWQGSDLRVGLWKWQIQTDIDILAIHQLDQIRKAAPTEVKAQLNNEPTACPRVLHPTMQRTYAWYFVHQVKTEN